jgi:hypothetical protein
MPTRELTPEGFSKTKGREFIDRKLGPKTLRYWREQWSLSGNKHMELAGLNERWDHRSLAVQREDALARGDIEAAGTFDRLPGVHLGAASTALERDGITTYWGDQLRAILAQNALRKLSREKKQVEESLAELDRRLRELRKEQEAEVESAVCTENADDPRWTEFEATFMRNTQELGLSFGEMARALPAFKTRFPAYMDAAAKQGWTPESLAQEFAKKMLEEDRKRMHAEALRDDPLPEPEQDRDFDTLSP